MLQWLDWPLIDCTHEDSFTCYRIKASKGCFFFFCTHPDPWLRRKLKQLECLNLFSRCRATFSFTSWTEEDSKAKDSKDMKLLHRSARRASCVNSTHWEDSFSASWNSDSCPCQVTHIQSVGTRRGWVHITWAVGWQTGTETGPIFHGEGLRLEWGRKVSLIKHYKSLENHLHFSTQTIL